MNHDFITLSRLRFFGHHGAYPAEVSCGQYFEVTTRLELPLARPGQADDLALTVDYREVQEAVRLVLEGPPRQLVECLAELVASALLERFPTVTAVEIDLGKPHPPVDFDFTGFFVHIRRDRANLLSFAQPTLAHQTAQ